MSAIQPTHCPSLTETWFQSLLNHSLDMTIVCTEGGDIYYASQAVHRILEIDPSHWTFRQVLYQIHPQDRRMVWMMGQIMARRPETGATATFRIRHHLGHWIAVEAVGRQLLGPGAVGSGMGFSASYSTDRLGTPPAEALYLVNLRDTSHRHAYFEEKLFAVANGNSEARRAKAQFLAIMSHELRTPINAINGFSQLLLRQRQQVLSSQQADMIQRILNNGKHLLALINDILDLSRLEAGRMQLHFEKVNLESLIAETVKELCSLSTQKGLVLETRFHLENPIIINDAVRLRQILVNLLSNAIKFTEEGYIWIVVRDCQDRNWGRADAGQAVMITVQDTGPGIDSKHLSQIFREFWQADQSTTRRYQGTGLGLAICYQLAKMMNGDIQVQSQVGAGATFRLLLPRNIHESLF
jgi:PAS domain S-box-containing protein